MAMGLWYFATVATMQHVAHDTPLLATTADVEPGQFYAFPDIILPGPANFSNTHYTISAGQSGDSPGPGYVIGFVCTPVTTSSFQIGFYNLTGQKIPSGTKFMVAFTCVGE